VRLVADGARDCVLLLVGGVALGAGACCGADAAGLVAGAFDVGDVSVAAVVRAGAADVVLVCASRWNRRLYGRSRAEL
jgi:hypothetical protein